MRAVYEAFHDVAIRRSAVGPALLASILGRPEGPIGAFARRTVMPRVLDHIGGWLAEEAGKGNCRALPPSLAIPVLLGSPAMHLVTRTAIEQARGEVPDRDSALEALTGAFCRGMQLPAGRTS